MSDIDEIGLSHRLNEIMLHFFKKEDFVEMLVHCVESIVMIPRFELISTIDILGDYILDKNKTDDFKGKVNTAKKQAETWILSSDNRNFSKLWNDESKEVPEKIQEMYKDAFELDLSELIEQYVPDLEEFAEKIEDRKKKMLRKWLLSQTTRETEKISEDLESTHLKELEEQERREAQKEMDKKFVGGKTFKERQREQEEMAKEGGKKESKKMEKIRKITELKYMDSIQEEKKAAKERFSKIFFSYEKKFGKIPDEIKTIITGIWYGDYFSKEDVSSDDILNIVKRYSLRFKIPNDHINGEVNKLILQTYIVGLYMGISVFDIYTIINDVLETHPTMSVYKIMPSMIHDGNVPNQKVQDILNPIIKNLPLHESQSIIRENWNRMRFPNINIENLVEYLKSIQMDASLRFKIISSIEDLSNNIVKKGLTIERFAREVYTILKSQTMKIPITEKDIKALLEYE